ncbi:DUF1631 family protein [Ectothiorhodospiraceae bacterium BW-2]|nr:DUF1631 family protein [Ectothiorhodospiraceae bacterium BW-2]
MSRDKRRHKRYPITLEVVLSFSGRSPLRCQARDFCVGGLYVDIDQGVSGVKLGEPLTVEFDTPEGGHFLEAEVVRIVDQGLGIHFTRQDMAALAFMQRCTASSPPNLAAAAQIAAQLEEGVTLLFKRALEQVSEALLQRTDSLSEQGERYELYQLAQQLAQPKRQQRLLQQLEQLWQQRYEHPLKESVSESAELSLIDTEQFERWLLLDRCAAELRERCEEPNHQLELSLRQLPRFNRGEQEPPWAIKPLLQCWIDGLEPLCQQLIAVRLLLDFWRDEMALPYLRLLQQLTQTLQQHGIGPERPPSIEQTLFSRHSRRSEGERERERESREVIDSPQKSAEESSGTAPPLTALRHYLRHLNSAIAASPSSPLAATPLRISRERLLAAAHQLPPERHTGRYEQLQQILAQQGEGQIEPELAESIQLADTLFSYVRRDQRYSPSSQRWFDQLEPSLFKALIQRPTLLESESDLLNTLCQSLNELAYLVPEQRRADYERVDQVVRQQFEQLHERIECDEQALQQSCDKISALTEEYQQHYQQQRRVQIEAMEQQQRHSVAEQRVARELDHRFAARQLPTLLGEIIEAGWYPLLRQVVLREGEESPQYQIYLKGLEQLLLFLDYPQDYNSVQQQRAFKLYAWFEKMLRLNSTQPHRLTTLLSTLSLALATSANYRIQLPRERVEARLPKLQPSVESWRPQELTAKRWQHFVRQGQNLGEGDRILFQRQPDTAAEPLELAWSDQQRQRYLFIDHSGQAALDCSLGELAQKFHQKTVSLLERSGLKINERASQQLLQDLHQSVLQQANRDELTLLLGRRAFLRELERAIFIVLHQQLTALLLIVNVNQFRLINQLYGNEGGDQLLRQLATVMRAQLGDASIAARINGDEFALLLRADSVEEASQQAVALTTALAGSVFLWQGSPIPFSLRAGAVVLSEALISASELINLANKACQRALERRVTVIIIDIEESIALLQQGSVQQLMGRLTEMMTQNRLRLRAQEIAPIDRASGYLKHYEILLSVVDEDETPLPLFEFIQAAESFGRMQEVDRWVVEATFRWLNQHHHQLRQCAGVSINLSGQSVGESAFLEFVQQQLAAAQFSPTLVCFEVTETSAVTNIDDAIYFINSLKASGCRFSLDDFGTGYASYAYLQRLPVDYLKIDGVFIKTIASSEQDYLLVKSINDIGHILGKRTVAEYVENSQILDRLQTLGVDYGQGYQIHRPVPLEQLMITI